MCLHSSYRLPVVVVTPIDPDDLVWLLNPTSPLLLTVKRYQRIWSLMGAPSPQDLETVSRLMPALVQAIGK